MRFSDGVSLKGKCPKTLLSLFKLLSLIRDIEKLLFFIIIPEIKDIEVKNAIINNFLFLFVFKNSLLATSKSILLFFKGLLSNDWIIKKHVSILSIFLKKALLFTK